MTGYPSLPPLGLVLKLRRARKQLRSLRRSVDRFNETHPCVYRRQINAEGTHYIYSLDPPRGGESALLIVDEAIHHIRSVLDHLVVAMNENAGGATDDCSFPIWKDEPKTPRAIAAFEKSLGLIAKHRPARTLIEDLQPYKRGDAFRTHPLWILSRLDNKFKHASLHLLVYSIYAPALNGATVQPPRSRPSGTRKYGEAFAEVPISIDVEKDFEPYISVHLAFDVPITGLPNVGLDTIDEIYDFVRDEVVAKFLTGLPKLLPLHSAE